MEEDDDRYGPWFKKGTYLNHMLHCGARYNGWVQNALDCLPPEVLDEYKEALAFVCTGDSDGYLMATALCEKREIIILSERILPRKAMNEASPEVRYFTFAVLHEVAHAYLKHGSPMFDGITPEENAAQEKEADALAFQWYNGYASARALPDLPELTLDEVNRIRSRNQAEMEARYTGSNTGSSRLLSNSIHVSSLLRTAERTFATRPSLWPDEGLGLLARTFSFVLAPLRRWDSEPGARGADSVPRGVFLLLHSLIATPKSQK